MKFGMLLIVFSALCFNMLTFSNAFAEDEVAQPDEQAQPSRAEYGYLLKKVLIIKAFDDLAGSFYDNVN